MSVMLGAFIMIFLAEMGDKSQFLAFCLAGRYRVSLVLAANFFATLINNGTAIFLGSVFAEMINMDIVRLVSGLAFLGFGAWTLLEKKEEPGQLTIRGRLGSFLSIVSLFILAEMGDKTQIASAVYAATYGAPLLTLAGVMAGMLLADSLGIFLGLRLRESISLAKIKIITSIVFFILGSISFMGSEIIPAAFIILLLLFFTAVFLLYNAQAKKGSRQKF
ncbi:MAG: TMEM165/GDT1 family protein [Bacillota bacterium]